MDHHAANTSDSHNSPKAEDRKGIWKKGKGKGRHTPKGRQLDDQALGDVLALLGDRPRDRDLLIEFLHLIQDKYGQLSAAHLRALAEELKIGQAEIYEVATFYDHFDIVKESQADIAPITIRICDSLSCELAGAQQLLAQTKAGVDPSQIRVVKAPCMGRCATAPAARVTNREVDHATVENLLALAQSDERNTPEIADYQSLAAYQAEGGYSQLQKLRDRALSTEDVIEQLSNASLRGMGGAGFPAGKKWGFVRSYEGPRLMTVNGDEGEPGTFKDRTLLEQTPHRFFEGALIAAHAVEATRCYIYMRDEYPGILAMLKAEITALEAAGLADKGFLELRRGAGAYICGEESAMIESIEGKRGLPRHRPPFIAEVGLFGRPTLNHNVETLWWIPQILTHGVEWFVSQGKEGHPGPRHYSVSGRVKKPGVVKAPAGATVEELIALCGGMVDGHTFKSYLPGGASGGILPASLGNVPLDFGGELAKLGCFVGSHAIVVMSDQDSAKDAAVNLLKFFEHESCGQCTPCRVGCEKAVKLMEKDIWDQSLLEELSVAMADASICGLGQAAPNPIRSVMTHFSEEV